MPSALEDKDEIRDLISRYCHYIDSGRNEEWVGLFTEDGAFDSPILGRWEGRAKLRDFTQAIMDLGATVCTRSSPDCDHCPVKKRCAALEADAVGKYPEPRPRKALRQLRDGFWT